MTRLSYKGQTRPLVRGGAPQRQDNKFQIQTLEKEAISGQTSTKWARRQDILIDWLSAVKWLWLSATLNITEFRASQLYIKPYVVTINITREVFF
jgi:hypothetical protein